MASGSFSRLSVTLCLFLCCYVPSGGCCSRKSFANHKIDAKDVYYVSQVILKPEIFEKFPQSHSHSTALSGPMLLLCAWKLLECATIVIEFISLADDLNPGAGDFKIPQKSARGLKIGHLNIRSLHHKVDQLRLELQNDAFDILTLSETWLDSFIANNDIQLPGYTCARMDRQTDKSGGGVIAYLRNRLPNRTWRDLSKDKSKCLWIEVCRPKYKSLYICCGYRAPDTYLTSFISGITQALSLLDVTNCEVILLCDFNVDWKAHANKQKQHLMNFEFLTYINISRP